jgi:hypothetical protein
MHLRNQDKSKDYHPNEKQQQVKTPLRKHEDLKLKLWKHSIII